jgi:uncharacterized protein (DUF2235 family)
MRRLIVCADGTWNRPEQTADGVDAPTNVVKLARAIVPVDPRGVSQIVYYQPGVGTDSAEDKLFGGAFGSGLDDNIRDCYRFLVHNYIPGDELYLFGFSRGAYTVRSLAGLLRNSGLLTLDSAGHEREAFSLYRDRNDRTHPNATESTWFRAQHAHAPVSVVCIGVWDTVGALGLPVEFFDRFTHSKYAFHDVTLSSRVQNAFHALAIDERRKPFSPTLWEQPAEDLGRNWLEQAWFPGVHANVGGGYPDSSLSDIALRWMIERVTERCRLAVDQAFVARVTAPSPTGELYDSMNLGYRMLGELERQIDARALANQRRGVSTWEYVHESAQRRLTDTASLASAAYRPNNLETYLRRHDPIPRVFAALPSSAVPA